MTSELFSSYGLVAGTEGTRPNPFEAIFTMVPSIAFLELCKYCRAGFAGFCGHKITIK